jgi:hypothetical protein
MTWYNDMAKHELRCGACTRRPEPPILHPGFPTPETRAAGYDYVMVKSGLNPVYRWECRKCQDRFGHRGTPLAD